MGKATKAVAAILMVVLALGPSTARADKPSGESAAAGAAVAGPGHTGNTRAQSR